MHHFMRTNKVDRQRGPRKFLDYAFLEAEHMRTIGRIGVSNNYRCAARRFAAFLSTEGMQDISFKRMQPQLLAAFEEFLRQNGVCRNTSSSYLRSLHSVYNRAVREGLATGNPFAGTYRGVAKTRKRAICVDDIRRLSRLDFRTELGFHAVPCAGKRFEQHLARLEFARDIFVFCFCSRGMTFVDLAYLRKSDLVNGTISYARKKTGQRLQVRVEPRMQEIIRKYTTRSPYLFPIIRSWEDTVQRKYQEYRNALQYYNNSLKEIGGMLGGLPLTSYVCRHSWATTAHQRKVPLPIISQAMGHDSEKTTEIYLKEIECAEIDRVNSLLLDDVFGNVACPLQR